MLEIQDIPSPNFSERPTNLTIDLLVMHYTGMASFDAALKQLCNPDSKVSSHYLVDEDGKILRLVDESKQAWHAGVSCWSGKAALNENSIGIEIVNPGHEFGYRDFPKKQMESVLALSEDIISRHKILPRNIVAHSDIAPTRKKDPGELFNWQFLATNGIGLYPDIKSKKIKNPDKVIAAPGDQSSQVKEIQENLIKYGYYVKSDGYFGEKTEAAVVAFKRHFIQDSITAFWDNKDMAVMNVLLGLI